MNPENVIYLPEGSLCGNCVHCMLRVIEPLDYSEFGLDEDDNNIVVQVSCLLLDVDLHDHVVCECSKFENVNNGLLMGNRFLV